MIFRLAFAIAVLSALYVMFKEPIKRWFRENNPFPGYDPLVTNVTITFDENDPKAQRLAFQLHSYLGKNGMEHIPFPVSISRQLPEGNPTDAISTASTPYGVQVHIDRSNLEEQL